MTKILSAAAAQQDLASWTRDGIAGLQSVVLYSLPELDGAIDTIPLGGLVGDDIFLVPERVKRLAARLRKWVTLRRTPPEVRPAAGRSLMHRMPEAFVAITVCPCISIMFVEIRVGCGTLCSLFPAC